MKTNVLIIQKTIPSYRIPIFNHLGEIYNLSVVYSEGSVPQNVSFKPLYVPTFYVHLHFHKKNLYLLARKYDVVICTSETSFFYVRMLGLLPRNFKLIYWGIGVAAGYNTPFDSSEKVAKVIIKQARHADAMLFYSDYPVIKYSKCGILPQKMFVANNTVQLSSTRYEEDKDCLLFIGSMYKQKGLGQLLSAYKEASLEGSNIPPLVLIGDGTEKEELENFVNENHLSSKITFTGRITDEDVLNKFFAKALLCISPNQAGLSVLKSMGYGVPFVTRKEAITGGEIFNIHDGVDGIIYNEQEDLKQIIIHCLENKNKYVEMGKAARTFYESYRTPSVMVQGFVDAINYVTQ